MKILLADNDIAARQEIANLLKSIGYEVVEVEDGVELLKQLRPDNPDIPDIVFTEILMPELNGHSAATIAKTQFNVDVPIIAVTDVPISSALDFTQPFVEVLHKPIKKHDVLKIILTLTCPNCCSKILSVDHKSHMHFNCKRCFKRYVLRETDGSLSIREVEN